MIRSGILFLFLFCFSLTPEAQSVIVKGTVEGGGGYIIRLIRVADLLSFTETTIGIDTIGPDGKFMLRASVNHTEYCYLDVELQRNEIFIQPGQEYDVELKFDPGFRGKPYFDQKPLDIEFTKDDIDYLNLNVRKVNQIYNDFILNNFNAIYKQGKKYLADTLKQQLARTFHGVTNPYFTDYLKYKYASIDQFSGRLSKKSLAEQYLLRKPILYNNLEYMYFFSEFFEKYLLTTQTGLTFNRADLMLHQRRPLSDFLNVTRQDPLLDDQALSEFYLMKNLIDLYSVENIPREHVLSLLQEIYLKSNVPENRQMALHVMTRLTELSRGTPAPVFSIVDERGKVFNNQSFRGKYLYLGFILSGSQVCRNDMDSLKAVYSGIKDRVDVLIVSADKEPQSWKEYVQRAGLPWKMLHYQDNIELLEKFKVRTFPVYLLIDQNGLIRSYPAKSPSEDVESLFNSLR